MLRKKDRRGEIHIVNGGVSGYSTAQEAKFLRRIGSVVDPDVVLIAFYWNDLLGPIQLEGTAKQSGEVLRMTPQHGWIRRKLRGSRALYIGYRYLRTWLSDGEGRPAQAAMLKALLDGSETDQITSAWERVESELRSINALARRNDWRIGILVLPPRQQIAKQFPVGWEEVGLVARGKRFANTMGKS